MGLIPKKLNHLVRDWLVTAAALIMLPAMSMELAWKESSAKCLEKKQAKLKAQLAEANRHKGAETPQAPKNTNVGNSKPQGPG
ncbi:MAG: hypothetical protein WCD70_05575 [Alphaproteobacteria bacterium]